MSILTKMEPIYTIEKKGLLRELDRSLEGIQAMELTREDLGEEIMVKLKMVCKKLEYRETQR